MPLPKPLRQSSRRVSSSTSHSSQRKICRFCHNLDPRGHPNSVYPESSKDTQATLTLVLDAFSLSRTKATTDSGCRFCNVLVQALDAFFQDWRGARQRVVVILKEKGSVKVSIDGEKWKDEAVEIYAASASRAPWPTLGTAHRIPTNSGSDDTFNFARRCIQDCLTNAKHTACKAVPKTNSATPKRLLDVGRVAAPIRLIDTQGKVFQYATLSHRWGTGHPLIATKQNWQKLSSNIRFEALSPLFQDAIIITRQLGLRYIWIDSLCIIQDSVRDWETESSKMGSIYENSYVTISATNALDGSAKCLVDRREPVKVQFQNTTGKQFTIIARRIIDHHPNVKENEPAKPMGPLAKRSWALQEHVLSTRILHYTATELLFECKTSYRCECMPLRKAYPTTPSLIPKAIAKKSGNAHAIWNAWHRIVEHYSRRDLTRPVDKLPAISGIASKIKHATQSSYLAGLWKDNLASDLLWSASTEAHTTENGRALEQYRAPTFSWASLDVPVTYYAADTEEQAAFKPTITLLSSSVSLLGLNPLGTVSDSFIQLRGLTLSALLSSVQREGKWEYLILIKGTSVIRMSHDCLLTSNEISTNSTNTEATVRRATLMATASEFKTPVRCLSIATYDTWISGLVLGLSERVPDAWERLGTFAAGLEAFRQAEEMELRIV